ncbi:hypothetical protein V8E55_002956 [Tylopilus felleus]
MDLPSFPIMWGPGYIGLTIALFLYGVEICQSALSRKLYCFVRAFMIPILGCHPSTVTSSVSLVYFITFMVQAFYAHRVWIISGQNIAITSAVLVSTTLQLLFGLIVIETVQTPTDVTLYSNKYLLMSSVASAVCDAIITLSVMYYLRSASIRYDPVYIQS